MRCPKEKEVSAKYSLQRVEENYVSSSWFPITGKGPTGTHHSLQSMLTGSWENGQKTTKDKNS